MDFTRRVRADAGHLLHHRAAGYSAIPIVFGLGPCTYDMNKAKSRHREADSVADRPTEV
ncbi:MAG: hypothetical protein ABR985_15415 [Methanotrichaceae archaeon]